MKATNTGGAFYPMRPMGGASVFKVNELNKRFVTSCTQEGWLFQPKYNGERALYDAELDNLWNRKGSEFRGAGELSESQRERLGLLFEKSSSLRWWDLELMGGKTPTALAKHAVVLDIPSLHMCGDNLLVRLLKLRNFGFSEAYYFDEDGCGYEGPSYGDILRAPHFVSWGNHEKLDATVEFFFNRNEALGDMVFEGFVAKKTDSPYTVNRTSHSKETLDWAKHRFTRNT